MKVNFLLIIAVTAIFAVSHKALAEEIHTAPLSAGGHVEEGNSIPIGPTKELEFFVLEVKPEQWVRIRVQPKGYKGDGLGLMTIRLPVSKDGIARLEFALDGNDKVPQLIRFPHAIELGDKKKVTLVISPLRSED